MTCNQFASRLAILCLAAGLLVGCGQGGSPKSFDNAPPEIKADWARALAADQANDYLTAVSGYQMIMRQPEKLSESQFQAAANASIKLLQRLNDASDKGDAAARQALDTLGRLERGQPLPPR